MPKPTASLLFTENTASAAAFRPSRQEGLARLKAFQPKMGRHYARERNYDRGAAEHSAVSCLSPYIRRRMVTEEQAVEAALSAQGFEGSEKFVQEIFWRSYFKGWLEQRPSIWSAYRQGLEADLAALAQDRERQAFLARVEAGQSGLDCFDAWVQELGERGYLHNHARLWFASIWIFVFGLPWRLGADFFYRHLLDGDPASNTLSWRWVAGLHTRGKTYEAKAWNIEKFTEGRFSPRDEELFQKVTSLANAEEPDGLPPRQAIRTAQAPLPDEATLLLVSDEDLSLQDFPLGELDIKSVLVLKSSRLRSPRPVSDLVVAFEQAALKEAAEGLGFAYEGLEASSPQELAEKIAARGCQQVASPFLTRGPLKDFLDRSFEDPRMAGITLREWQRPWDQLVWPHATAGFFKVKQKIPAILSNLDMT